MREILFRGKEIDTGKWVEGWYERYPFSRWPVMPVVYSRGAFGLADSHGEVTPCAAMRHM
jgi:hypothetical protein